METRQVDGHNLSEIIGAIQSIQGSGRPGVIVCDTIKGKDIPFAERQPIWHYRSLTDQQYSEALVHLEKLEIKE
jgi:transketolase